MSTINNHVNLDAKFQQGVQLQQNGNLKDAEYSYLDILKTHPLHPGANTMLGIIYIQTGRENEGVKLLEVSLTQDVKQFWAHNALGVGLLNLKKYQLLDIYFSGIITTQQAPLFE